MKRLKLFPKTFLYTLALMVFVVVAAHILIYLLASQKAMVITMTNTAELITVGIGEGKIVMQAIQSALPLSLICCLVISVICTFLFSQAIVSPIESISASAERMMKLDHAGNMFRNPSLNIENSPLREVFSCLSQFHIHFIPIPH